MEKDAFWFPHDSNARHDRKCVRLIRRHGWQAYGVLWAIVEQLRDEPGYRIPMEAIEDICFTMQCPGEIIEALFDEGLLESDGTHFWSESLLRRMRRWDEKKQRRVEAGRLGGVAKAKNMQSSGNATPMPQQNHSEALPRTNKQTEQTEQTEETEESPPPTRRRVLHLHPQANAMCQELLASIRSVAPHVREPNMESWAKDMDRIIRIDQRTPESIRYVLSALPSDQFWSGVILSPSALRKNFDKVLISLRRPAASQYDKNQRLFERWEQEVSNGEKGGSTGSAGVQRGMAGEISDDGESSVDLDKTSGGV